MNSLMGQVATGQVTDENEQNYFVQLEDGNTYRLDKAEIKKPLKLKSVFKGFAYENNSHNKQITRTAPNVRIGRYGWSKVVSSRRDLGVFVDIGLSNKDIVVSLDNLPTEKKLWPKTGDKLLVRLDVDDKDRMWAIPADSNVFQKISLSAKPEMKNKNITATSYRLKMSETLIITDHNNLGFIHPSERDVEPRLGQSLRGRVISVGTDGVLNVSLKPRSYEAIGDDASMLIALLEHDPNHHLKLNDHSSPEDIKNVVGLSKSQFKRALGHILKTGSIIQDETGISLKEQ
ncbi:CvfB family protein [Pediococcus claussenii]|uniref:DNA-binding protein n=1 Tax=Pediococcus claussenii (strain ATCC BAA-344 / DSM 14800 / JCM 18046 / KCTC 3811 / LMG 21948 / P06) TaxID=701521 RepID=G8PD30_PEDCP|nr:S1-like domain-containing RNA-binding protein [Pediococcus claussenii]AEV95165.1 hypothetical protein PECL_896 [Pediococcus claussenii ATCC BAA-344]ANZ70398.1 DNA-binding protein [Pediococcus claussenii]ANZ72214.1 DNA-binding protein [Pediococcus claussenii]KRN19652.1 hypothetical protein IV79_GL001369 [Pediococcus claussenii]